MIKSILIQNSKKISHHQSYTYLKIKCNYIIYVYVSWINSNKSLVYKADFYHILIFSVFLILICFLIIIINTVGDKNKLENYVHLMKQIISDNIGGHIIDVHYILCDLYQIKVIIINYKDISR